MAEAILILTLVLRVSGASGLPHSHGLREQLGGQRRLATEEQRRERQAAGVAGQNGVQEGGAAEELRTSAAHSNRNPDSKRARRTRSALRIAALAPPRRPPRCPRRPMRRALQPAAGAWPWNRVGGWMELPCGGVLARRLCRRHRVENRVIFAHYQCPACEWLAAQPFAVKNVGG